MAWLISETRTSLTKGETDVGLGKGDGDGYGGDSVILAQRRGDEC